MKALIKYGGAAMEEPSLHHSVAREIVTLTQRGMNVVVVHGGGKEVTDLLKRLGKETRFVEGIRYTDTETMEVAEMILSGLVNKRLVSFLNQEGGKAVGISGRDGRMFKAKKTDRPVGFVGDILGVDCSLLNVLLEKKFLPVVSPIAEDEDGNALNINADEAACAVAGALEVDELIFLSDVDGILIEGKIVESISLAEAERLLTHPEVTGGMIPKLTSAVNALKHGVVRVRFINGERKGAITETLLNGHPAGTTISR